MIKVYNVVSVYEIDDCEVDWQGNTISIRSHWNENRKVVLEVGKKSYTVVARELSTAIANATNSARL